MRTTLIATGGTVAWHGGEQRMLSATELAAHARVEADDAMDLAPLPSSDISIGYMATLASTVRGAIAGGADVVVVLHGTDTMEESAWLTELLLGERLRQAASVLFTGAMRFVDDPEADGPANLASALAAGRDGAARGRGVFVAWGGELHPARSVHKVDAASPMPFESTRQPLLPPPEPGEGIDENVALLKVGPTARPPVPTGVSGLVLEGTGAAHVPSSYNEQIMALIGKGTPVVLASRCRDVPRKNVPSDGPLYAGDLSAEKAALALMVALARHQALNEVRSWWSTCLGLST
jgi:L-asparaginase